MNPIIRTISEYRDAFSSFTPNAKRFLAGNALVWIASNLVQLLFNLYLKEAGYAEGAIGALLSTRALGSALVALPASLFIARIAPERMLPAGAFLTAAAYAGQALLPSGGVAASVLASGAFSTIFQVSAGPFFMRNSGEKERLLLFSLNGALSMLTGVVGSLLGGLARDLLAPALGDGLLAYRIALLAGTAFAAAAALPFARIDEGAARPPSGPSGLRLGRKPAMSPPSEPPRGTDLEVPDKLGVLAAGPDQPSGKGLARAAREALRSAPGKVPGATHVEAEPSISLYIRLLLPGFLTGMGAGLTIPYLNLYFKNVFFLSDSAIGGIVAAGQVATFIGMMAGPGIARRMGRPELVFWSQALSVPFILVLTWVRALPLVALAFLARQTLMNMSTPVSDAFGLGLVPPRRHHLLNALRMLNWTGSWMVAARVSGVLIERSGFEASFVLTAALYAVSTALYGLFFVGKGKPGSLPKRA
ncbi:MAG: MFS transporter [Spirochaetia bacterium]|nr:MFS transporter [Spirochaetia bacterium]